MEAFIYAEGLKKFSTENKQIGYSLVYFRFLRAKPMFSNLSLGARLLYYIYYQSLNVSVCELNFNPTVSLMITFICVGWKSCLSSNSLY